MDSLKVELCLMPLLRDSRVTTITDYYVMGPTWESKNPLMRKYIWPNVHITVGAGVESGREGCRGRHVRKWRNMPGLESHGSLFCGHSVCWMS